MLSDFFRINLPYGMVRDNSGRWMAFNRSYKPLGFNVNDNIPDLYPEHGGNTEKLSIPIYTKYDGLTEHLIEGIAAKMWRDEQGKICRFYLYTDATNPMKNNDWDTYLKKLQKLAKLKRSRKS